VVLEPFQEAQEFLLGISHRWDNERLKCEVTVRPARRRQRSPGENVGVDSNKLTMSLDEPVLQVLVAGTLVVFRKPAARLDNTYGRVDH
jgi:hypothetical protein